MKNESVELEIEKMKEQGPFNYTFPKNYSAWSQEDKKELFLAILEEKEKIFFKQEFVKRHRRRIFAFSALSFISLSFINPILGAIISGLIIVGGYFLEKAVQVIKL